LVLQIPRFSSFPVKECRFRFDQAAPRSQPS
jgi:hypothetical protein